MGPGFTFIQPDTALNRTLMFLLILAAPLPPQYYSYYGVFSILQQPGCGSFADGDDQDVGETVFPPKRIFGGRKREARKRWRMY